MRSCSVFLSAIRYLLSAVVAIAIAGCVRSSYNVATRQQEYTITSTQKEVETGRALAARAKDELELVDDEPLQERVRTIGQRLAEVCDRQELRYEFTVVHDQDANAFSLPGGYIFIYDGLIKKVDSNDELAAVLAHEIAHVTARHAVKRYETSLGAQLVQLASLAAARGGQAARGLSVALHATRLAYARQDELEADRLGVKYVKAAGYDPTAALRVLELMRTLDRDRPRYLPRGVTRPHYAQTHPFVPERIRAVKEELYGVADYVDYLNTP